MAKAKKPIADDEDGPKAKKSANLKKVHERALKRYKLCTSDAAEIENRKNYRDDMKFTYMPGEQWTEDDKKDRGKDRPMYEFNESRVNAMSVINHIRANRPAAKIRGVEEGDKDRAEIRQGLYLNITNNSDFDSIKDYAAGHQVAGGMGAWRVDTEYSTDTAFDQDIVIRPIINPMCLHFDPSDKTELKVKAKYCFLHSKLSNEEYEAKYPEADRVSFEPDEELDPDDDEESTWVAEYWEKVPTVKHLCLLSDGTTIDKGKQTPPEGVTVVREKKVNTFKVVQYIISGDAVLEGPNDWAGTMLPFIPVYGYYVVIDSKVFWCGLTRYQKDPQRALNWAMTSVYESIGNAPQSKYWATAENAKGNVNQWAEAAKLNLPAMIFNPDPANGGRAPERMGGADVPVALINAAGMARDALKASVGIFNASLGAQSNETSGKAIRARQDEGMVATFNFGDNMAKSERRTCEIVNDLYPGIYDTERSIRILGQDGAEKYLKINSRDPMTGEVINDMSAGKFDFTVTTGPSFATQRQEAAEFYMGLSQSDPSLMQVAGDLIIKSHDYPMADAIAERKKLMLPPPILQAISKDKPLPPEVQAAMAQVEQAQQQVAIVADQVAEASQQANKDKNAADKANADVKVAAANLKVEEAQIKVMEANLAKQVAEFKTLIAETEAKMAADSLEEKTNEDRGVLNAEVQNALQAIQAQAAELVTNYAQQLAQMVDSSTPKKAASKSAHTTRTPEGNVTVIEERDEAGNVIRRRRALQKRVNGSLQTEMRDEPQVAQ